MTDSAARPLFMPLGTIVFLCSGCASSVNFMLAEQCDLNTRDREECIERNASNEYDYALDLLLDRR